MLVLSNITSLNYQFNSNKIENKEYLHKAVNFDGSSKKIEFKDKETGKIVEIYLAKEIEEKLEKKFSKDLIKQDDTTIAKGRLEDYLQKIWLFNKNETNTVDDNNDGYLDINELAKSKRVVKPTFTENGQISSIEVISHNDMFGSKIAKDVIEDYLKERGITDNKVSFDLDFNATIYADKNLGSF